MRGRGRVQVRQSECNGIVINYDDRGLDGGRWGRTRNQNDAGGGSKLGAKDINHSNA